MTVQQPNFQKKNTLNTNVHASSITANNITKKDYLNISWHYFQQHAQQRIGYFNFFLLFSSFLTAAMVSIIKDKSVLMAFIGVALGIMQIIIAFIFWKIDERNKALTKNGENTIKQLENECRSNDPSFPTLFISEEEQTKRQKKDEIETKKSIFLKQISHSKAFIWIFLLFGIWGIVEVVVCLIQLIECISQ